jgi:ParB family chromosome partitioning protein
MSLIENIQRENLNPLEEAAGIKRLIDEFSMTHQAASEAVGRSRTAVTNLLRLLNLATPVQEMLMHNRIDMGHARALLGLEGAKQIATAEQIAQKQLSVREAERLVQRINEPPKLAAQPISRDLQNLQESLSERLGARVVIRQGSRGKGRLSIDYSDLDQLEGILERLGIAAA